MNLLLKQYIKNYLLEAASTAIAMPASSIGGEFQHNLGASYQNDMTSLNDEEVLIKVLENVGNNCFISFVNKYDDEIPRLEVSPNVSYDTPHGNYCYPLTEKSLKDIIEKSRIGGTSFAFDRPYFHLFKRSNNINSININRDGSNNYSGNVNKDLETLISTALMFLVSKEADRFDESEIETFEMSQKNISADIKKIINTINDVDSFTIALSKLAKILNNSSYLNNNSIPASLKTSIVLMLKKVVVDLSFSKSNKFWLTRKEDTSEFHVLYYSCWLFSTLLSEKSYSDFPTEDDDPNAWDVNKINEPQENKIRQGPVFTMLLNSIDIDFINDKGSQTLHSNEPIQAVYLNSSKKESIVLIGTFNNIFQKNKKDINDLILFSMTGKSQNNNKKITMDKIVNVIDKNPNLNDLFDSSLFDDPKFVGDITFNRESAWKKLTSESIKIAKLKLFHSTNKIFNFQISKGENNIILFDIGFKDEFLNLSPKHRFKMISENMSPIVQVQMYTPYILEFLNSYTDKDIYSIQDKTSIQKMSKVIQEMEDYSSNYDKSDVKDVYMKLRFFLDTAMDIENLCYIATNHSGNNGFTKKVGHADQSVSQQISVPKYIKEDAIDFTTSNEVVNLIFDDTLSEDKILIDISLQDSFLNLSDDDKISRLYDLNEKFSTQFIKEDIVSPILKIQKKSYIFEIKDPAKIDELKAFIKDFKPVALEIMQTSEHEVQEWFSILGLLIIFANRIGEV